ncbi:MAG: hypothetical protein E6Q76_05330 [Rhizobium sp.]|nr:MAG: hypothetical protein E6Q76_05330 [Rhizobium sp.]
MKSYVQAVIKYRKAVLVLMAILAVAAAMAAQHLRVIIDLSKLMPQNHPYIVATNEVQRDFGGKNILFVAMEPAGGDICNADFLKQVRAVDKALDAIPYSESKSVTSIITPKIRAVSNAGGDFSARSLDDYVSHDGPVQGCREFLNAAPIFSGLLFQPDHRAATVVMEFKESEKGYRPLLDATQKAINDLKFDDVQFTTGGAPRFIAETEARSDRVAILLPIAILIVALVLYSATGTRQAVFLPLLTAFTAMLFSAGIMGASGVPLDVFNTTTPILIFAVAAGHAVQLLSAFQEAVDSHPAGMAMTQGEKEALLIKTMVTVSPVTIAACLVAAISFFSLTFFDLSTIRTFGLFSGIGILCVLFVELTLIPAIRVTLPIPRNKATVAFSMAAKLICRIDAVSKANPKRILIAYLGIAALFLMGFTHLYPDNSLKQYFRHDAKVNQDDVHLASLIAGTNQLLLVVEAKKPGGVASKETLAGISALQDVLEADQRVGKTLSIADYLSQMDRGFNGMAPGRGRTIPASTDLINQYLFMYSIGGSPKDLDGYITPDHSKAYIAVILRSDSTRDLQPLIDKINQVSFLHLNSLAEVRIGGSVPESAALNEVMIKNKSLNVLQIAFVVFLVSAILFRSIPLGLLVLAPLLGTTVFNLGLLGWVEAPLNIPAALGSALAIGIGADFAIYMLYRIRKELGRGLELDEAISEGLASAGLASVFVAFAVALGYGTLVVSYDFLPHAWLGGFIASSMLASVFSALLLIPCVVRAYPTGPVARALLLAARADAVPPRLGATHEPMIKHELAVRR